MVSLENPTKHSRMKLYQFSRFTLKKTESLILPMRLAPPYYQTKDTTKQENYRQISLMNLDQQNTSNLNPTMYKKIYTP